MVILINARNNLEPIFLPLAIWQIQWLLLEQDQAVRECWLIHNFLFNSNFTIYIQENKIIYKKIPSSPSGADDDDAMTNEDDGSFMTSFYLGFDANSSTTFSSRANTPHSEMLDNTGADNVK